MANLIDLAYALTIGPHYLWHRFITNKYGPSTPEKTGDIPDRFKGAVTRVIGRGDPHYEPPCLWVHAVSVGEVNASRDLIRKFMADNPLWEVRVTTTTATGRKVATDLYGAECVFYYPLDFSWMVEKAFKRIRPSLIVLMELEIWPNFLAEAKKRQIPVAVANARITERSVKRLAKIPSIAKNMAETVEEWYAQTDQYKERLESIGVPAERIEVLGSIKYDSIPEEVDVWAGRRYRRIFGCQPEGGRKIVVAGSTHPNEEKSVLDAWQTLTANAEKPRLVIVPRHPERLDKVEALAKSYGTVVRRSNLPEPEAGTDDVNQVDADIILGDTMGELAKIYTAADIVFVGGTLANRGGQNFMEPCGLGKATVVGPNLWNFAEPAELLRKNNCITVVKNKDELAAAFANLLQDSQKAADMGARAREVLVSQRGAVSRIITRLDAVAARILRQNREKALDAAREDYLT